MKKTKMDGKTYKITGYTKGAAPLANAKYYHSKGYMKGWQEVKNLSIRRKLAKRMGK